MKQILLILIVGLSLLACGKSQNKPAKKSPATASVDCSEDFTAVLNTTKGEIEIEVRQEWSPNGARRFCELVREGYYTDVAFFRVIPGFMAQAGIHGDPAVNTQWRTNRIPDDPVKESNQRGMVSFASGGPNTRTTQFFINFKDNKQLDGMGFAPFGKVNDMTTVDQLYSGYGEGAPRGKGPSQMLAQTQGNTYLKAQFPEMDYIINAKIK